MRNFHPLGARHKLGVRRGSAGTGALSGTPAAAGAYAHALDRMASDLGLVAAAALWPAGDPRIQDRLGNPLSRLSPSGPSVCDQAFVADLVLRHSDQFNAVTARAAAHALRPRRMRSWALHEPPIERREYQDNADVYY